MERQAWQDWVTAVLGAWLIISPMAFRVMGDVEISMAAEWNCYICGVLALGLGIAAMMARRIWEEWADVALGAWLVLSPWVLGFTDERAMFANAIVVGALMVLAAGSMIATDRHSHA